MKEVEELQKQVNELRHILNEISSSQNQANTTASTSDSLAILVKSALTSSCSSITMVKSNQSRNFQANL
jgi:hypothetical protein